MIYNSLVKNVLVYKSRNLGVYMGMTGGAVTQLMWMH